MALRTTLLLVLLAAWGVPASAQARPGSLDRSFGKRGVVREIRGSGDYVRSAFTRGDGATRLLAFAGGGASVLAYDGLGRRRGARAVLPVAPSLAGTLLADRSGGSLAILRDLRGAVIVRLDRGLSVLGQTALDALVVGAAALSDGRLALTIDIGPSRVARARTRLLRSTPGGVLDDPWPGAEVRPSFGLPSPTRTGGAAVLGKRLIAGGPRRLFMLGADGTQQSVIVPGALGFSPTTTCDAASRCVVVGATGSTLILRRVTAAGRLRRSVQRLRFRSFRGVSASAAAFDRQGRLLVTGRVGPNAYVARFDRQGRPDRRFGRNGIARLRRPSGRWIDEPLAVGAVPGGVIIAGTASASGDSREDYGPRRVLIARFDA